MSRRPTIDDEPRSGDATSRRAFLAAFGGTAALLALGCEDPSDALVMLGLDDERGPFAPPRSGAIDDVTHVLNRLTWGPRPGDHERVTAMGARAFIADQLDPDAPFDRPARRATAHIETFGDPTAELYEHHPDRLLSDLTRFKVLRGVHADRQLFEVMVDFWTDHLNVVAFKGDCQWLKLADDRDVIRAHAMGRFRDLVRASALSPAMLIYLDGHDNKVEHPGDRPNENYARELLELHTLGVHGGYTQRDVMEVARCLSGWTYEHAPIRFRPARVAFDPARHDDGAKEVLGHRIPAGGGADDLERVLDIVCAHRSTARHVAMKLCRRFVDHEPPADTVRAVAEAFESSGGDVRATLAALFGTDGFWSSRGTLFKRPLRFVLSALRATDARTDARPDLLVSLDRMGHAPFQYPTPDGHPLAPEPWLGTLLWRWRLAADLERNAIDGTRVDVEELLARAGGLDGLGAHLLGRAMTSEETDALASTDSPLTVLLASPAFQMC